MEVYSCNSMAPRHLPAVYIQLQCYYKTYDLLFLTSLANKWRCTVVTAWHLVTFQLFTWLQCYYKTYDLLFLTSLANKWRCTVVTAWHLINFQLFTFGFNGIIKLMTYCFSHLLPINGGVQL